MGKTSVMETRDMDGARFPRDAQNALDAMGAVWRSDTVGTWHWDLRTGTACWNTRMVELLGLDPAASDASSTAFLSQILADDRPRIESAIAKILRTAGHFEEEFQVARPDGGTRWLLARCVTTHGEQGGPSELLGVIVDITGRKHDEIEMQRVAGDLEIRFGVASETVTRRPAELKRLAAQLTQAELAERKRIASLLHDTVQQTLVAAILGAEKARRQTTNTGARETLTNVITAIQEVVARTRLLSIQLDPPVLAHGTLSESLRWLSNSKREQYGLRVAYEESPDLDAPSEEVRFFLFEAARELLFNVVKHGGVLAASMRLGIHDGALCLSVDDEGRGCDPALLDYASREQGIGLAMIRDRAAILGGEVSVTSAAGAGFHVRIRIPLDDSRALP